MSDRSHDVPGSLIHYAAYQAIERLTLLLPLELQYGISRVAAEAYFKLDRDARESVCANLKAVLPAGTSEWEIRREARRVFRSFGRYLCEFFGFERFSGQYIDDHLAIGGREHIDDALRSGRGFILCSGHYSNWELGAAAIARMGYPILAVTQMHAHPKINALFVDQRAKRGVEVVHSSHGALRAMKALLANRGVAMLGDRPTGGPSVEVQWFGRATFLPQGPWRIALRTGAALLPAFVSRTTQGGYTLEIQAPITLPDYNDCIKDLPTRVQALAQNWAQCWENQVRNDPSQWEVFYSIWGAPDSP